MHRAISVTPFFYVYLYQNLEMEFSVINVNTPFNGGIYRDLIVNYFDLTPEIIK